MLCNWMFSLLLVTNGTVGPTEGGGLVGGGGLEVWQLILIILGSILAAGGLIGGAIGLYCYFTKCSKY